MKLVFTDEARADLMRIGDRIAENNPARAETFIDELQSRCVDLTATPRAYPLVPRYESRGIRRLRHGDYLVFYRLTTDTIEIIHVLHGARDYETILFPNENPASDK